MIRTRPGDPPGSACTRRRRRAEVERHSPRRVMATTAACTWTPPSDSRRAAGEMQQGRVLGSVGAIACARRAVHQCLRSRVAAQRLLVVCRSRRARDPERVAQRRHLSCKGRRRDEDSRRPIASLPGSVGRRPRTARRSAAILPRADRRDVECRNPAEQRADEVTLADSQPCRTFANRVRQLAQPGVRVVVRTPLPVDHRRPRGRRRTLQ